MTKKKVSRQFKQLYLDSEWKASTDTLISVQLKKNEIYYFYYNSEFLPDVEIPACYVNKRVFLIPLKSLNGSIIDHFLNNFCAFETKIEIVFHYSVRDLYYLFNQEFIRSLFYNGKDCFTRQNVIFQMRNIKGNFEYREREFKLRDTSGWEKKLETLLSSLSINNDFKKKEFFNFETIREDLKKKDARNAFVEYALKDVCTLEQVLEKMTANINGIYTELQIGRLQRKRFLVLSVH